MNPIMAWLFALTLSFAPPSRGHQFPGWAETDEQRSARYQEIVKDIYAVAFDENEKPIPGMNRTRTAAYLLALAIGESGLDPDADKGPCYRGPGWQLRCDSGNAATIFQIKIGDGFLFGPDGERVRKKDLFADRKLAARLALRYARGSFWSCRKLPMSQRLAVYGGGSCSNEAAQLGSEKRWTLATKLWEKYTIPKHITGQKLGSVGGGGGVGRTGAP